jgi:mono/diheme cytochrome c family protein
VASEQALTQFGAEPRGRNPFVVDSAFRALGDTMFARHCMVCHGPQGRGDGPIVQTDAAQEKYPIPPPTLTAPTSVARSDGYLYALVWVGRGLMPAYGPRTTHRERWAIVQHIRQLQGGQLASPTNPPGN